MAGYCKLWVTDENGDYVAGNKNYHRCDLETRFSIDTGSSKAYYLNAHVRGSAKKTKHRGPFVDDVCYDIRGLTYDWTFDPYDHC
jgi:hypothetical protein